MDERFSPTTARWHIAALCWAAFVAAAGLLTIIRVAFRSSLARLIEFKDVPMLAFFEEYFGLLAWVTGAVGVSLAAAAVAAWRARPDRTSAVLAVSTCATVATAIFGNRYVHGADGVLWVPDPGRLTLADLGLVDWAFLLALVVASIAFMRSMSVGLRESSAPDDEDALADRSQGGVALVYLLSVAAVVGVAVYEHLKMWSPEKNGGFDYARFLAPGEMGDANLVLFSTSLLIASLAGVLACSWWAAHRLSARDEPREVMWQSVLIASALATITTIPWLARLSIEIRGEENWFFVPAVVVPLFALLAPVVFVAGFLLREDFARAGAAPMTRGERCLITSAVFPVYPLLRLFFPLLGRGWATWSMLMVTAASVVAGVTMMSYELDSLYSFEDWRGMFKKSLFPVMRVALSVGVAGVVVVLLHRLRLVLGRLGSDSRATPILAGAGRWLVNGLALACLVFASWPFWGWNQVPRNVLARTVEFSGRHDFERRFLQWLLDFDGDGYSALLQGGDPDDRDPLVQGGGVEKLERVALPQDEFKVVDPARAKAFPNLVMIFLEGVTPKSICGYGMRVTQRATPGMDGVLEDGAHFTRAYCPYPSTWDGWFTTLSGRQLCIQEFDSSLPFADRYSRYNNLHKVLKAVGINRWCYPNVRPFKNLFMPASDVGVNFEDSYRADTDAEGLPEGVTKGELRADRLVRFVNSIKPGERFFLSEHLSDSHFPWKRVPDDVAKRLGFKDGLGFVEHDAYVNEQFIGIYARYYHAVSRVDAQVQKVVRALKQKKLYDDTMIVIVSDHGCQWYEHEHCYYVSHLYDQSLRVPLIIRVPGQKRGVKIEEPVLQMDVLPTIMELAGVASSRPLFGQSVASLLSGATATPDLKRSLTNRDLLLKTHYDTLGVMSGFRHKLILDRPTGTMLLFDLLEDPGEMTNLADQRPDLLQDMLHRLRLQSRKHMVFLGGIEPSKN